MASIAAGTLAKRVQQLWGLPDSQEGLFLSCLAGMDKVNQILQICHFLV